MFCNTYCECLDCIHLNDDCGCGECDYEHHHSNGCPDFVAEDYILNKERITLLVPENPTNGDIIFALNETAQVYGIETDEKIIKVCIDGVRIQFFDLNWWNAPYKQKEDFEWGGEGD